jgi:hypothetical protein
MLLYILLAVICIIISFFLYLRVVNRFWGSHPVFHSYNLLYHIFPIGIIHKNPKITKKYYDPYNIEFHCLANLENIKQKQFLKFIKHHYFTYNKRIQQYSHRKITSYFKGHNSQSYISFYTQPKTLFDFQKKTSIKDKEIIGVITTRPLYITCRNKPFNIYYIDYNCLLPYYRKDKYNEHSLIHTHLYKQMITNRNIKCSFFTRNKPLDYTKPFITYQTYLYDIRALTSPIHKSYMFQIITINEQTIPLFTNFMNDYLHNFKCHITSHLSNLSELIKTQTIIIYGLITHDQPLCFYIFKNSPTLYENQSGTSIELFSSLIGSTEQDTYLEGFPLICQDLYRKYHPKYLRISDISFNDIVIKHIMDFTKPIMNKINYIYLYNYIEKQIKCNDFFAIY